jgi:cytochrome c peroxidase
MNAHALFSTALGLALWLLLLPPPSVAGGPADLPLDCDPAFLRGGERARCRAIRRHEGRRLFEEETFGGNGRTCATCHSEETGTFSPEDVHERLLVNANDPLFRHDGLDGGVAGTTRIEQHATVRITLPLPPHIRLANDPNATEVTVNRGTPSTLNTPALDPGLMYDLRDATLEVQALGAIRAHAQNGVEPTPLQLELIAEFQRTAPRFFSNGRLRKFANGGPPPDLPRGDTASERRGRLFFVDAPFQPPDKTGVCALCHSGPMLNVANVFSPPVFGNPPGARFFGVGVTEANFIGNPTYDFIVEDGLGPPVIVNTPDIGILLTDLSTAPVAAKDFPPLPVIEALGLRLAFLAPSRRRASGA